MNRRGLEPSLFRAGPPIIRVLSEGRRNAPVCPALNHQQRLMKLGSCGGWIEAAQWLAKGELEAPPCDPGKGKSEKVVAAPERALQDRKESGVGRVKNDRAKIRMAQGELAGDDGSHREPNDADRPATRMARRGPLQREMGVLGFSEAERAGTRPAAMAPQFEEDGFIPVPAQAFSKGEDLRSVGVISVEDQQGRARSGSFQQPHIEGVPVRGGQAMGGR